MNSLRRSLNVYYRTTHRSIHKTQAPCQAVVQIEHHKKLVKVTWKDGTTSKYPFIYLREKCQCEVCWHSSSQQRLLHMRDLNLHSKPRDVLVMDNGDKIAVTWQDNHISEFHSEWLYNRRLPEGKPSQSLLREGVQVWNRNFKLPNFDFDLVVNDENTLFKWLLAMRRFGVTRLTGVPRQLGQLERFGNAVGYLKNTFYGESVSLISEFSARSLAYSNVELQPHTDLPYYEFKPGVILLQFIDQVKSTGGENTLVDGFNILKHFKKEHPRFFDLMVSTPVLWQVIGTEEAHGNFKMTFPRPVIEFGWTGKIARINYNEPLREGFVDVPLNDITEVYKAYHALTKMFYDQRFVVQRKMAAGEMLTIDNDRLLHGRTAFKVNKTDRRWLHQAYLDWDVLNAKIQILKEKCGNSDQ